MLTKLKAGAATIAILVLAYAALQSPLFDSGQPGPSRRGDQEVILTVKSQAKKFVVWYEVNGDQRGPWYKDQETWTEVIEVTSGSVVHLFATQSVLGKLSCFMQYTGLPTYADTDSRYNQGRVHCEDIVE